LPYKVIGTLMANWRRAPGKVVIEKLESWSCNGHVYWFETNTPV